MAFLFFGTRVLRLVEVEEGVILVSCRFKNCEEDFIWCFMGVYVPTTKIEREVLWGELGVVRGLWQDP